MKGESKMAKYLVKFSCGHEEYIDLVGKYDERKRKIAWYEENGLCPHCYEEAKNAKNAEGCKEVEMKYSEYKNCYENCKTKANSYNKSTKTIIVYVPVTFEEEKAKKEAEQEAIEEIVEIKSNGKELSADEKASAVRFAKTTLARTLSPEHIEKIRSTNNEAALKILDIVLKYQNKEKVDEMTANEMIKKYGIQLYESDKIRICKLEKAKKENAIEMIKSAKAECIAILTAEKEAKERESAEREAKIKAIDGLKEIKSAISEWDEYQDNFNNFIRRGGIGICPQKPESDIEKLKLEYPKASAYLKAENWSRASNYAKAASGKSALEKIINSEDYNEAISTMEKEWTAYCEDHI